jgi:hypothetical protein
MVCAKPQVKLVRCAYLEEGADGQVKEDQVIIDLSFKKIIFFI